MKKNGLLKIIAILALVLSVLSWIIPSSYFSGTTIIDLGITRTGIYELLNYPILTIQYFSQYIIFIVTVGGFYGVLEKTGKYRNILEKITKSLKRKEKYFLIGVAAVFAILSSITGLNLMLFIFIPAIMSIILLLGYDKITTILVTIVSIFIGMIGATYSNYVSVYIVDLLKLDFSADIITKIALLVITFVVYMMFTLKYAETHNKKIEKAEEVIPFIGEKKQSKVSAAPLYIIFGILLVLLVLSTTNWLIFEVDYFTNLHTAINEFTIGEHTIFAYLLGDLGEFGTWSFVEISTILLLASFIVGFIYKLNIDEILNGLTKGIKKMIKPAYMIVFAMTIVMITAYHPFYITITEWIMNIASDFEFLQYIATAILTVIGSVLNVEVLYLSQSSLPYISTVVTSEIGVSIIAAITQAFYGLTMFIAPTSMLLILGLEFLHVSYISWIKKIGKLVLQLLVIISIVILITLLVPSFI